MTQVTSDESLMAEVVDEFLDRQARGEAPGVEEYAERYPQIAEFIRQMLPTLGVLRAGDDVPIATDGPRRLGDFRIVREVGRGGMGVVYEAEQLSLGRRVALKVLPFASALDRRQLARFRTEAQAAGQLHHTHIVPVYFVGDDRGVHFFAMQFIDGRTVADLIADLRREQPPAAGDETPPRNALSTLRSARKPEYYRWVAEAGVQAAEALEHAHAQGVVHRDVKPANLMRDHAGHVWVTDFGLAQVRTDVRLTATGDVVGTLRYMSPEQALRPAQVDHRTDVYSLGVTLYEMLTLRPAFPTANREELLRQLADREPPSARAADRTIPVELDVIVRKAMAKEPDERYATAKDLAADLRRFLDNRPIAAKPPTVLQYAKKWARRHRPIVTAAVVGVFVALLGSSGFLLAMNAKVRAERQNAVTERQNAVAANEQSKAEKLAAQKARDAAQEARDKAETNFGEYQRAMFALVESNRWRQESSLSTLQHQRAKAAEIVTVLRALPDELEADPNIQCLIAVALSQEGLAAYQVGDKAPAKAAFAEAEGIFATLINAAPRESQYRHEFAWLLDHRAMAHLVDLNPDAAAVDWDRAMAEVGAGLAVAPKDEKCRLVKCEAMVAVDRARHFGLTVRRPETLAEALTIAEGLCADFPAQPEYRFLRARIRGLLSERLPPADAAGREAALRELLGDLRALVVECPKAYRYRNELFRRLSHLGKAVFERRREEAEDVYQEALAYAKEVTGRGSAAPNDYHEAAALGLRLGILIGTTGPRAAEAVEIYQYAIDCQEEALQQDRSRRTREVYRQSVVTLTLLLSQSLGSVGRFREAEEAIERAIRHEGTDAEICQRVGHHFAVLAKAVADRAAPEKRAAAAEPYYRQAILALRRAADRGYDKWTGVRRHPAFAAIKDRPEFVAIIGGK